MCNKAVRALVSKSRKRPCIPFGGLQLFADGGDDGADGDNDDPDDDSDPDDEEGGDDDDKALNL